MTERAELQQRKDPRGTGRTEAGYPITYSLSLSKLLNCALYALRACFRGSGLHERASRMSTEAEIRALSKERTVCRMTWQFLFANEPGRSEVPGSGSQLIAFVCMDDDMTIMGQESRIDTGERKLSCRQ